MIGASLSHCLSSPGYYMVDLAIWKYICGFFCALSLYGVCCKLFKFVFTWNFLDVEIIYISALFSSWIGQTWPALMGSYFGWLIEFLFTLVLYWNRYWFFFLNLMNCSTHLSLIMWTCPYIELFRCWDTL